MTTRFCPPWISIVFCIFCLALALTGLSLSAADYTGPILPVENAAEDLQIDEPPQLPKKNPLLQRPKTRQLVFDDLDPVSPIVPQNFLDEEELDVQPTPIVRQRKPPQVIDTQTIDTETTSLGNAAFIPEGEMISGTMQPMADYVEGEIIGEYSADLNTDMGAYLTGPMVHTFGMSLFDNLTLSAEATTFKTALNNRIGNQIAGSYAMSEGINWSTPITPQGTIAAQFGVRAVHGDMFSDASRHQTFLTAGIFKRLDFANLQIGAAVDWLHDHSGFGSVDVRQMRAELSMRSFSGMEYGFTGGFNVFQDRPTTPNIDQWALGNNLSMLGGAVDVQNYYLLFVRKHLNTGGQVELRCGATEWGDLVMSAQGEAAINDRWAVNGGFTMLAPAEGHSAQGNARESWVMSLGIVFYFRGGAVCRQTNLYRPMFDVAGNNSFFPRIIGR